jgi:hypothetical protein
MFRLYFEQDVKHIEFLYPYIITDGNNCISVTLQEVYKHKRTAHVNITYKEMLELLIKVLNIQCTLQISIANRANYCITPDAFFYLECQISNGNIYRKIPKELETIFWSSYN